MATYSDLFDLAGNSELQDKIAVASVVAAYALLTGSPSASESSWASSVISNPRGTSKSLINAVLAANKDQDVSTILGASDSAIQNAVDSVVAGLITGE